MSKLYRLVINFLPRAELARFNLTNLAFLEIYSHVCKLGALIYLALMPLQLLQRSTYISENALMPDYVTTFSVLAIAYNICIKGNVHYDDKFRSNLVHFAGKLVHSPDYFETVKELLEMVSRQPQFVEEGSQRTKVCHVLNFSKGL